jgi:flagellar assembly protein FliH
MVQPWNPPSFDEAAGLAEGGAWRLPTADEVDSMHRQAREKGREEGYAQGMADGYAAGFDQGREEGRQAAYQATLAELTDLSSALAASLEVLREVPQTLGPALTELAYDIARRLSGREGMERAPFLAAVQEALMRLPRPGETLFVRMGPGSVEAWQALLQDAALPFSCEITLDHSVGPGHAFVELDGARVNVGGLAREALLRMALGLPIALPQGEAS